VYWALLVKSIFDNSPIFAIAYATVLIVMVILITRLFATSTVKFQIIKTYDDRLQSKLLSSERPNPLNEMQIDILRDEIKELREENARLKSIIEGGM
jgi:cell division septal protein FtsQ